MRDPESPAALESPSSLGALRFSLDAAQGEGAALALLAEHMERIETALASPRLAATALHIAQACSERFPVTTVELCRRLGPALIKLLSTEHPSLISLDHEASSPVRTPRPPSNDMAACSVLANLAFVDYNCPLLMEMGAGRAAVEALKRCTATNDASSLALALQASRLLRNLAAHPDSTLLHDLAHLLGGADAAVGALICFSSSSELTVETLGFLANAAEEETNLQGLQPICASVVVKCLGQLGGDVNVLQQACRVVANLSLDERNASEFCKRGAAQAIVAAMQARSEDAILARDGCDALANLFCDGADKSFVDKSSSSSSSSTKAALVMSASRAALGALTNFTSDATVCEEACCLVGILAAAALRNGEALPPNEQDAEYLFEQLCKSVMEVLLVHAGDADIVDEACYALCELLRNSSSSAPSTFGKTLILKKELRSSLNDELLSTIGNVSPNAVEKLKGALLS